MNKNMPFYPDSFLFKELLLPQIIEINVLLQQLKRKMN